MPHSVGTPDRITHLDELIELAVESLTINLTQVEALLTSIRDNTDQLEGFSDDVETLLITIRDNADTIEVKLQSLIDATPGTNLTSRMSDKHPADGYALWLDTEDADHIYTLEAPVATTAGQTGFRGIRVTKSSTGDRGPLGKVEINESATLTFTNRTTDGGWS